MNMLFLVKLRIKLGALYREQNAAIAIEFAFIVPVLLILIFGTLEVNHYVSYRQKTAAAADQMINLVNQNLNLSLNDAQVIMSAAAEILKPFEDKNLSIILTAIQQNSTNPDDPLDVMWQVSKAGSSHPSKIAPAGQGSQIQLDALPLQERDQVMLVEIFNEYEPLIDIGITKSLVAATTGEATYEYSFGRPRYGAFQLAPK
jgi:Flp pilus assembly protein TadG